MAGALLNPNPASAWLNSWHAKLPPLPTALGSAAAAAGEGRAHSAIDDARNTARLAVKLMQSGVILVGVCDCSAALACAAGAGQTVLVAYVAAVWPCMARILLHGLHTGISL